MLAQVTIPDKGSHYLKKSPSPTGSKPPPGEGAVLSPAGTEDGSPVRKIQQVGSLKSLKWESVKESYQLVSFLSRLVCPEQERILIEKIMREVYVYKEMLWGAKS